MKILLVYPYFLHERLHEEDVSVAPIGLYYVGALLRENHYDVEILNWHSINRTPERIEGVLAEKAPDVIGLSVLHGNRWGALEISRVAKQINCRVKIVYGGIGATFLWRHLLENFNEIDFIVLGEGEYAFLDLIRCIGKEDHTGIEKIRGIAFRKNGTAFMTGDPDVIQDLESRSLNLCLGISYMNLRNYQKALPYFLKFKGSREADEYIAACYKGIGRS